MYTLFFVVKDIHTERLEVVYINIVEDWLKGPRLMTAKGRIIWTGIHDLAVNFSLDLTTHYNRIGICILVDW